MKRRRINPPGLEARPCGQLGEILFFGSYGRDVFTEEEQERAGRILKGRGCSLRECRRGCPYAQDPDMAK